MPFPYSLGVLMCFQGIIWAHLNTTALYISIINTYATLQCRHFVKNLQNKIWKEISQRIFYKKAEPSFNNFSIK